MVTLSSAALLTACSSHKNRVQQIRRLRAASDLIKAKTSSKDSGKTSNMLRSRIFGFQGESSSKIVKELLQVRVAVSLSHHLQRVHQLQVASPKLLNLQTSNLQPVIPAPKSSSDSQASSSQSSSQAQAKTDMQVTTVDMDVSAVARGQFDSIAGLEVQ
ncbi:MAG: hypothetical protein ACLTOX_01175 [Streptococcus thermophilus]